MEERAKSIWKAWVDGKEVQTQQEENGAWKTVAPIQVMPEMMPQRSPDRWRIKPKSKIFHFRIYFSNTYKRPHLFSERDFQISSHDFEKDVGFGGWISDWMSHEVEVEEC